MAPASRLLRTPGDDGNRYALMGQLRAVLRGQNIVIKALRTGLLQDELHGSSPNMQSVLESLRQNCSNAVQMNRLGDYPAMQTQACNRYAQYAWQLGVDPGRLPTVMQTISIPYSEMVEQAAVSSQPNGSACAGLLQQKKAIQARMRAGYRDPEGECFRAQLREIEHQLDRINCDLLD